MEGDSDTASLRKAAAHWSLAGDKQLLDLLQNLHERIVNKCQEANSGLEEMVNTLDTADISLQNVNNKLMALSNSQFVENRVYEDNVDVTTSDPPVEEPPKPTEPSSELSKLRDSLRILEAYHEPVHIVDSDSESVSDEEEDRTVFKPKDLYSDRPLPYIIGSQQWRSKWHAGLVADDSDTDSDTSKVHPPSEQYSESEPDEDDVRTDKPHASQRTISTNSSISSELTIPTVGKPADIAAELARRLGGNVTRIPESEPESPPATALPTKVYRPQQPTAATIFPDEPPPLDACQSDRSEQADLVHSDESDSEDDVFAELHRAAAHRRSERSSSVADQLFGDVSNVYGRKGGFHDDGDRGRQPNTSAKQPSALFEESQDSELFVDNAKTGGQPAYTDTQSDITIKKPIGGISLFGNNHGAESIGAAILKRNQRQISISDEEDEEHQEIPKISDNTAKNKAELGPNSKNNSQKDIINALFSKSSKTKQTNEKDEKISAVKIEKPVNKKVDLFTDDLFDDIDDIFTNVKPLVTETKQSMKKSLFDDDDDDLFGDVAAVSNKTSSNPEPKGKSIFDSDDELFSEEKIENNEAKFKHTTKSNEAFLGKDSLLKEGIENINKVVAKTVVINKATSTATPIEQSSTVWKTEHEDILPNTSDSAGTIRNEVKPVQDNNSLKDSHVKSIFDSDSDDAIFSDHKSANNYSFISNSKNNTIHNIDNTSEPDYKIDESAFRKAESVSVSNRIHNDNYTNNEKEKILEDDPLFKQEKEPLNSTEGISTLHNENVNTKNNISIDKFEDNNKKTDILIESMKISSAIEKNTNIYTENKLLSSTNIDECRTQNNAVSSLLNNINVPKTLFQSPSLFDEDDDMDDIFTKSSDSNKSKEIDTVLQNSTPNQLSKVSMNEDNIRDSQFLHTEESNEINSEIINEYEAHSQIIMSDKADEQVLENDKPQFLKDSKDLRCENNTNLINHCLEESEVPIPSCANISFSKSVPGESMLEEKKENKTEYDIISDDFIQKEHLFSDIKETVSDEPDIFSDIFSDIPPEFDRPKKPKRSKNVNALFDDDSDDEALFFKKNEIVSDDKPDISFTSQDDRLFHIFHDEPPAIDVDFTQTSKKAAEYDFATPPAETYSEIIASQTDLYGQAKEKSIFKEETRKEPSSPEDSEISEKIREAKKPVGKLKPMNLNINVNSLLPGASPKKHKTYEQVDGQVISTKTTEEDESKMVKSVSFEGDPESEILDNKLSKERAKIQVKRRPSSRRARKEAVRKSGIEFGDDSTDNSAATDISKEGTDKIESLKISKCEKVSDTFKNEALKKENSDIIHHNEVTCSSDVIVEKQVKCDVEQKSKLFNTVETNLVEYIKNSDTSTNDKVQGEGESSNLTTAFNKRLNVQSKVVYILNDEDIFTDTKPGTNISQNIKKESENTENIRKNKVLNIVDDDDELFKSGNSKNTNIETLGNVYKNVNSKNNEIDSFDSDEDIFKASQSKPAENTQHNTKDNGNKHKIDKLEAKIDKLFVKTQSTKVKSSLFDDLSDDESELFGSKKSVKNPNITENSDGISTLIKKSMRLPKNDVKTPLFGNESDDDGLFGVTTTKKEPTQPSLSRPKEVMSKPTELVFEDPLSMLTQDEDI